MVQIPVTLSGINSGLTVPQTAFPITIAEGGTNLATVGTVGQVLQSTGTALAYQNGWIVVEKTTEVPLTMNAVLTNDGQLFFPVLANTNYRFRLVAYFTCSSAGGYQFGMNGPASPTFLCVRDNTTDSANDTGFTFNVNSYGLQDDNNVVTVASSIIEGILQNGVNAGTVNFQWAQKVSDSGATTLKVGSYLEYSSL